MRTIGKVFFYAIPAIIAVAAGLLFLLWIMGASAVQGERASHGYNVGFWALIGYASVYQLIVILMAIVAIARWPLVALLNQIAWLALVPFAGAMAYAIIALNDYLKLF